jgi:hypothetical protein
MLSKVAFIEYHLRSDFLRRKSKTKIRKRCYFSALWTKSEDFFTSEELFCQICLPVKLHFHLLMIFDQAHVCFFIDKKCSSLELELLTPFPTESFSNSEIMNFVTAGHLFSLSSPNNDRK